MPNVLLVLAACMLSGSHNQGSPLENEFRCQLGVANSQLQPPGGQAAAAKRRRTKEKDEATARAKLAVDRQVRLSSDHGRPNKKIPSTGII